MTFENMKNNPRKMRLDALGDRMKAYEAIETSQTFMPNSELYVRLDGRSFSKFTKDLERPFDKGFINLMQATSAYLLKEYNAHLAYCQSDEISLIIPNSYDSPCAFEGKKQKLLSNIASSATAFFVANFQKFLGKSLEEYGRRLPTFDCRIFALQNQMEVINAVYWRHLDCIKNSKQMLGRHYFTHKELQNLSTDVIIDKLLTERNIRWSDQLPSFLYGTFISKTLVHYDIETKQVVEKAKENKTYSRHVIIYKSDSFTSNSIYNLVYSEEN